MMIANDPTESDPVKATRATKGAGEAEIYRRLAGAIADNRLPPGSKLGEENLAKFFNVSRARIRDVLRDLAREKLATIQPNRGAYVASPSVEDALQISQARRIIEGSLIANAVAHINTKQLAELGEIVSAEAQAWERDDRPFAIRKSREFHIRLAQLGGNMILAETLETVISRWSLASELYGERRHPGCLCQDHTAILDAISQGDGAKAEQELIEHLNRVEDRMHLQDQPEEVSIEDALRDTE